MTCGPTACQVNGKSSEVEKSGQGKAPCPGGGHRNGLQVAPKCGPGNKNLPFHEIENRPGSFDSPGMDVEGVPDLFVRPALAFRTLIGLQKDPCAPVLRGYDRSWAVSVRMYLLLRHFALLVPFERELRSVYVNTAQKHRSLSCVSNLPAHWKGYRKIKTRVPQTRQSSIVYRKDQIQSACYGQLSGGGS